VSRSPLSAILPRLVAGPQHLAVVLLGTAVAGLGAGAQPGQLLQLSGPGACVSQLVTDGICAEARALNGPDALAVSPDGRSVYVASSGVAPNVAGNSGSIAGFARDAATGRIAQPAGAAGCVGDLGGQAVRTAGTYAAGTAVCSGVVPEGLAGCRLAGTVKVTAGGATRTARFSFPIG
jgi:hypothetical protein